MAKYPTRFKLKIVKQFLAGPFGGRLLARQHGLPYSMIYRWVTRFQLHGREGLAAASGRYDAATRLKVLRHMWRKDLSYSQAAALFGIGNASTIARWDRQYHDAEAPGHSPGHEPPRSHDRLQSVSHPCRTTSDERPSDHGGTAGRERAAARPAGASRVLRRPGTPQKKSTEEKARAVEALRHQHPLEQLLQQMDLPRSTFYHRRNKWAGPDPKAGMKTAVRTAVDENPCYGYRRVTALLKRQGEAVNHKSVQRVMQELRLQVPRQTGRFRSYRGPGHEIVPNILQRDFNAVRPNERWVTDVTEFAVGGEKCYLSPIMDLYNSEIVAYQLSRRPTLNMVQSMVRQATRRLGEGQAPVLHSDQGWHYQHAAYRRLLGRKGLTQSMSAKGNCLDNAAMESFFSLLKNELFRRLRFDSIAQLEHAIRRYIRYYNHKRIKLKLNGLSPVEYRTQAAGLA